MVTIQEEDFKEFIKEVGPLLQKHWEEIALDKARIDLQPDWAVYDILYDNNKMHVTTARDGTKLVGYAIFILTNALHYKQLSIADGDVFWLDPEYRKGLTGYKLLKKSEGFLGTRGVQKIFNKVKLHKDVGKVFERLGYTPIERVYAKGVS
mgnify:CR=1 FL=1|tara:strand:+ start:2397 stop:2849 length:453 start_codon:yes stop_codon:yes gene_type:complete